jgi:hypothetical protein
VQYVSNVTCAWDGGANKLPNLPVSILEWTNTAFIAVSQKRESKMLKEYWEAFKNFLKLGRTEIAVLLGVLAGLFILGTVTTLFDLDVEYVASAVFLVLFLVTAFSTAFLIMSMLSLVLLRWKVSDYLKEKMKIKPEWVIIAVMGTGISVVLWFFI